MTTITIERELAEQAIDALDALGNLAFIGHGNDFQKAMVKRAQATHAIRYALAAPATAPAWHDAPTCAGLWVNMMSGRLIVITEETLEAWQNAAVRWYGPISPDGGQS